jgi:hypothetical protein
MAKWFPWRQGGAAALQVAVIKMQQYVLSVPAPVAPNSEKREHLQVGNRRFRLDFNNWSGWNLV